MIVLLRCAALCVLGGMAAQATAAPEDEPFLPIIPRTPAEQARIDKVLTPPTDFTKAQPFEHLPGGATTVRARRSADAFSQPSKNIGFEGELNFKVGNGLFRKLWVTAPSSTLASDGLGPLFNARSCQRCHIKDGRGHPPEGPQDNAISMLLRISVPAQGNPHEIEGYLATLPDPNYGGQLQDGGTAGQAAEYRLRITYDAQTVTLNGGQVVTLRAPTYHFDDLAYGPMAEGAATSPRVAPQMIGLGLLEAIPAADILAWADPQDTDGDGISGRPNIVWSSAYQTALLGRFGLKAGVPSIREQTAAAFSGDIGISSPLFPAAWGDCTPNQTACRTAPHGDTDTRGAEVDEQGLDLVSFYSRNLAVPARRAPDDPQVLRGKEIFYASGCQNCHRPAYVTHRIEGDPAQSFQLIWPYTDMLLHDMGPGLADGAPEGRATGQEWRTPPLWGIGLTQQVSGHTQFLHDGRARSVLEAMLWHGGEAQAQRDAVVAMPPQDRADLIRFLESL